MWVAKNDLCTHINQFINKEQAAFKHLLVYQYRSFGLYGCYQYNRNQVRRKARPWGIIDGQNRTINQRTDFIMGLCRNMNIISSELHLDTQFLENIRYN